MVQFVTPHRSEILTVIPTAVLGFPVAGVRSTLAYVLTLALALWLFGQGSDAAGEPEASERSSITDGASSW